MNSILNDGKIYSMQEINKDREHAAKEFCEGNINLYNLLLLLWNNNFETKACCNGHINNVNKEHGPYISLVITKEKLEILITLITYLLQYDYIDIEISNTYKLGYRLCIRAAKINCNLFIDIINGLNQILIKKSYVFQDERIKQLLYVISNYTTELNLYTLYRKNNEIKLALQIYDDELKGKYPEIRPDIFGFEGDKIFDCIKFLEEDNKTIDINIKKKCKGLFSIYSVNLERNIINY